MQEENRINKMNILITGGAGFIGSHLVKLHLGKNDDVWVIDNLLTGSKENIKEFLAFPKFHFKKENLEDANLTELPKIDIIYNMASPASPKQYKDHPVETLTVNSYGVKNILDFLNSRKHGILMHASTSEIYGDPQVHPQKEDYWGNVNPIGERSCYDEGKRFAEALIMTYIRKFNIDARLARIFNTYGPNMEQNDGRVVSNFISRALQGKSLEIYGDGRKTRSFCYIDDTVRGLHTLATKPGLQKEIVNLGSQDERKIIDLAQLVKKILGSSSEIVFKPEEVDDPQKRQPDIDKAKKLLDWEPKIGLHEGLQKTAQYFKVRFGLS